MTLGKKIVILLLVLGMTFSIGTYVALNFTFSSVFSNFERETSGATVMRVEQSMESDLRALGVLTSEYAFWDHTYAYVQGRRPEYADENLDVEYWHSIDIDMFLIFDSRGNMLYESFTDPTDGSILSLNEEIEQPLIPGHPLVTHTATSSAVQGLLQTGVGLMQVVSMPILTTDREGPIAGSLVTGQFIDDKRVIGLDKRFGTGMSLDAMNSTNASPRAAAALQALLNSDETRYFEMTDEFVIEYRLLTDFLGAPAGVLEVTTPRQITKIGSSTIDTAMIFLCAAISIILLTTWLFMQRQIVAPLRKLTEQILGIQRSSDLDIMIGANRSDEVGTLANEFGNLTSRLSLAQQESEKARDEAVAMSKTKSEFLARMSHEIRTPMNGVLGMTELLQDTQLDHKQQRFTRTIYESAETLLDIINDILDFSKIEAGKLQLDLHDIDLHILLEETVDSLANQAHTKGLELINMAPFDLRSTVQADASRLRQVLTNLVSNAIKFTEKGEVILRVTATEVGPEKLEVLFEIEDTGIGIRPEKQQVIFDSFAQEDGSTTRRYGGTGLGLAICKQLVELMGGTLAIASIPGTGSTFSFKIPMKKGDMAKVATLAQSQYVAGNKVLIVDDSLTNMEILKHQLTGWRAHTDSALSASNALAVLESAVASGDPHDLAILDMHMPEMDGLELARAIRNNPDLARLKLVMLSSVATPVSEEDLKGLDIAGQLMKPIRQSQLYDSLAVVLGGDAIARTHANLKPKPLKALSGRVLLAEDNPVNQAVAIGMLETLGLTVIVTSNGREAVEKAAAENPDVILMDCQMPGMDGFQATEAIRSQETGSGKQPAPIIAVTANALKGDRERCLRAGMNDYLTKPFTSEQLHSVLSLFLQARETAHSANPDTPTKADGTADTPAVGESPIDHTVLDVLSNLQQPGAPNILQKVIDIYLESSRELKNRLRVAIDTANATLVQESAHALKSSSANVGASGLADLCKRLEIMGREEDLTDAPTIHDRFEHEYARVIAALKLEAGPVTT